MDPKVAISLMSLQSQVQGLQGGLHKNFGNDIQYSNYTNYNSNPSNSSSSTTSGVPMLNTSHGRRSSMSDITRGIYNLNNNINANRMISTVVKEKLIINSADSRSTASSVSDIHSLDNFQLGSSKRPGVESDAEDGSSSVASFKGISSIREESGILHAENYSLRKIKRALEEELEKTRRELAEAQAKLDSATADSINSKPKVNNNTNSGNYLDSDVQKLCDLSKFLSDENASLQSKINQMETELKTLRSDKENQESDFRKLSEAISKAMEEATAAQKTIRSMQEEEIRLKQEKARLESIIKSSALALEKAENENINMRAKAERLELAILELQRELSDTRHESLNSGSACNTPVLISDHQDAQYSGERDQKITISEELERGIISADAGSSSLTKAEDNKADRAGSSALTFLSVLRNYQLASSVEGQRFNPEEEAALVMEIQRMASGLSTSMLQMEKELLRWKNRVGDLENALSIAKEAADSSDKKATQLISEFRWMQSALGFSNPNPTAPCTSGSSGSIIAPSPLITDPCPSPTPSLDSKNIMAASRYKLPATIASSAFAGASMLAAMKFTKYCSQSTAK